MLAPAVIAVAVAATILLSGSVLGVGIAVFVWGFFFASWGRCCSGFRTAYAAELGSRQAGTWVRCDRHADGVTPT